MDLKRLYRSRENRMIAGVAGGIGEFLGVDPTIVRLLILVALIAGLVPAALAYLAGWVIIPEEPVV